MHDVSLGRISGCPSVHGTHDHFIVIEAGYVGSLPVLSPDSGCCYDWDKFQVGYVL